MSESVRVRFGHGPCDGVDHWRRLWRRELWSCCSVADRPWSGCLLEEVLFYLLNGNTGGDTIGFVLMENQGLETGRVKRPKTKPFSDPTNTPLSSLHEAFLSLAGKRKEAFQDSGGDAISFDIMENQGSENRRAKRLKTNPFSDFTNTPLFSPSFLKSKPDQKPVTRSASAQKLISSSNLGNTAGNETFSTPAAKDKKIFSDSGEDSVLWGTSKTSIVYTRKKLARRKGKENAVASAPTLSCPPVERLRSTKGEMKTKLGDSDLLKSFSVPCNKKIKEGHFNVPRDFVEKQKEYFKEIDAFELAEEEASASELE